MHRDVVIELLKSNKADLQKQGIERISLFGSTARGSATDTSDVDLAVVFDKAARIGLFEYAALRNRLHELLGVAVDVVVEPARNARMQAQIDRDRIRVY